MGKAKKCKKSNPNFGGKMLVRSVAEIQDRVIKWRDSFYLELLQNDTLEKDSQGIELPWIMLVHGATHPIKFFRTVNTATQFVNDFCLISLDVLSKIDFTCLATGTGEWLKMLKGLSMHVFELAIKCLSTQKERLKFITCLDDTKDTLFEKVSTTVEVGLAYNARHIIFAGKSLTAWIGVDSVKEQGELMIAVKRFSNCYSYYQSTETILPPLSDYKKLKNELEAFEGLKGKLLHSKSEKLVKILNLQTQNGWAFVKK